MKMASNVGLTAAAERFLPVAPPQIIEDAYSKDQHRRLLDVVRSNGPWPLIMAENFSTPEEVIATTSGTIPEGVTLKVVMLSEKGEAFVDFSPELSTKHSGGSLDELLTVYAIVNTLTINLPAIARVQILIDGKEVDTLAGHVDLRRPLVKNLAWTRPPDNAPQTQ